MSLRKWAFRQLECGRDWAEGSPCCDLELGLYPIGDGGVLRNKMHAQKNITKSIRE